MKLFFGQQKFTRDKHRIEHTLSSGDILFKYQLLHMFIYLVDAVSIKPLLAPNVNWLMKIFSQWHVLHIRKGLRKISFGK